MTPLAEEADWQACRERLREFERHCPVSPFLSWDYAHAVWNAFERKSRCWLVEVFDPEGETMGTAIWREHRLRRRFLKPLALRSLDFIYFMRMAPFLMRRGREAEACGAMVEARRDLARASGADLGVLFRQDPTDSGLWINELRRQGVTVKTKRWRPSPQLEPGEDIEAYLEAHQERILKDLKKQAKRVRNRFGAEPEFTYFHTADLGDDAFEALLDRFEALQARTWQYQWEEESGRVDHAALVPFTREAFRIWWSRGLLEVSLLTIDGRDAAFWAGLTGEDRVWCLLIGYDPEFKSYSPGKRVFVESLRRLYARGFRLYELGGDATGWKAPWATGVEDVLQIEWPLGGWKGRVWSLAQRLRRKGG